MKHGMPVIVMQVSRMNDPPQPWSLQFKGPFSIYAGGGLARMRGGPRQIQDSQKGVINKSAHKERGGGGHLTFYFCFIFKQILSVLSGLTVHGLQAS